MPPPFSLVLSDTSLDSSDIDWSLPCPSSLEIPPKFPTYLFLMKVIAWLNRADLSLFFYFLPRGLSLCAFGKTKDCAYFEVVGCKDKIDGSNGRLWGHQDAGNHCRPYTSGVPKRSCSKRGRSQKHANEQKRAQKSANASQQKSSKGHFSVKIADNKV